MMVLAQSEEDLKLETASDLDALRPLAACRLMMAGIGWSLRRFGMKEVCADIRETEINARHL